MDRGVKSRNGFAYQSRWRELAPARPWSSAASPSDPRRDLLRWPLLGTDRVPRIGTSAGIDWIDRIVVGWIGFLACFLGGEMRGADGIWSLGGNFWGEAGRGKMLRAHARRVFFSFSRMQVWAFFSFLYFLKLFFT